MAVAVAILDRGLREDFGFRHVLFVFSGRRGLHCWVCDERARRLTDEQRAAVASYFTVYKGREKGMAKLSTGVEEHPAITRAHEMLQEVFESHVLREQGLLEDPKNMEAVLQYVPNEAVRSEVRRQWSSCRDGHEAGSLSESRWQQLQEVVDEECRALRKQHSTGRDREGIRAAKALEKGLRDILFAYVYPRLDIEVSKKMNHLLKAPFCVHPKTGKVCVPIDPNDAWKFNPEEVCTVGGLLNQLSMVKKKTANTSDEYDGAQEREGWQHTDMADAVTTFHRCFLDALQSDAKEALMQKSRDAGAAMTLAW